MNQPLVIIHCLVYNHEPYLRQCLDGFVIQQTNFPFYAVVHDDASTDNSAAIIREYAEKYPDIIHPIYEDENQWSKKDGSLNRIMNDACKDAKYIAFCEGDDYWTDSLKLQKQVDAFEADNNASLCYSDFDIIDSHGENVLQRNEWHNKIRQKSHSGNIFKLLLGSNFVLTCTTMYRADVVFSDEFVNAPNHMDYMLSLVSSLYGNASYLPEVMACYRVGVGVTVTHRPWMNDALNQSWDYVVALFLRGEGNFSIKDRVLLTLYILRKAIEKSVDENTNKSLRQVLATNIKCYFYLPLAYMYYLYGRFKSKK